MYVMTKILLHFLLGLCVVFLMHDMANRQRKNTWNAFSFLFFLISYFVFLLIVGLGAISFLDLIGIT